MKPSLLRCDASDVEQAEREYAMNFDTDRDN
jgi:hypothetical protein